MMQGIIITLLQFGTSVLFFDTFSRRRYSRSMFWLLFFIIGSLFGLLLNLPFWSHSYYLAPLAFCGIFVFNLSLYSCSWQKRIIYVIGWYSLLNGLEVALASTLTIMTGYPIGIFSFVPSLTWLLAILEYGALLISSIFIRMAKNRSPIGNQSIITKLLPIAIYISGLILVVIILTGLRTKAIKNGFATLCTFFLVVIIVLVMITMDHLEKNAKKQQEMLSLKENIKAQSESIEALSAAYTDQRKKTHDFNAQLLALSGFLQNGDVDGAKSHLKYLLDQSTNRIYAVNTHHAALDAIFNQKMITANSLNIDMRFEFNDLSHVKIRSCDLAVLIGNLLDNALEACSKLPPSERIIEVKAFVTDSFVFSVRNRTDPVRILNGNIITTKDNPALHGYGLLNIENILKEYPGSFHTKRYEEGWFYYTFEIENTLH